MFLLLTLKRKQCKQCSFHELLERDSSFSIQTKLAFPCDRNIQDKKGTTSTLGREIFPLDEEMRYKLGNRTDFAIRTVNSVR